MRTRSRLAVSLRPNNVGVEKKLARIHKIMAIIFFHINTFKKQVVHFEETKEPHSAFSRYVCGTCLAR